MNQKNTISPENIFKNIIAHCKEYGFIFPSSEIYDGLSAVYDYGPYGIALKKNIENYWWKSMVQLHPNIVGIDAAIFMHPKTWKASGHVDAFNDPLIDNKDSKKRYRADVLIEEALDKIEAKTNKEIEKAKLKFGAVFEETTFRNTNPNVLRNTTKIHEFEQRFKKALELNNLQEIFQIIIDLDIVCPVSGTKNWTEVRQFNLMFSTQIGALSDDTDTIYLRPETAQGIFVNFLNVQNTSRLKLPFGIAQIGKAFRNEIVARQFIFRTREFEQMEMQFFVKPGTEMQWYEHWKAARMQWHLTLFSPDHLKFLDHLKTAHYANAAVDIQFNFPFGFKELEGIHSRTDFDLKSHQEHSGKKLQYFDAEQNQSFVPYVVETSVGLNRTLLAVLCSAYQEELLEDGTTRTVLKIPFFLAPIKVAIFPLIKKDGLPEKAKALLNNLKWDYDCFYEEKDTIGKRYRRMDAIGTPFCITIDHETLQSNTVTLRHRDTMQQVRISLDALEEELNRHFSLKRVLRKLEDSLLPL